MSLHSSHMIPVAGLLSPSAGTMAQLQDTLALLPNSDSVDRGLAMFDRVDTDHDGNISRAERDAARGSRRDNRGRATMAPPLPNTPQSGQ